MDGPLDITMHDGFDFWLDPGAADDPTVQASLERANAAIYPTVRLAAAQAAYWCQVAGEGPRALGAAATTRTPRWTRWPGSARPAR